MSSEGVSTPATSSGIIRFSDADTGGPKFKPEMILGIAVGFIFFELVLQLLT